MTRIDVVQALLDRYVEPSYIEIGVGEGRTFNEVVANKKIGIDPAFRFATKDSAFGNRIVRHHAMTSDAYFASRTDDHFDVAFLDGLHTFEQTLRDLLNVTDRLQPGGCVVIDDINPSSFHASLPNEVESRAVRDHLAAFHPPVGLDSSWMGDVYRLVFFVKAFMQTWSYACVAETRGQMVMWREPRAESAVGGSTALDIGLLGFPEIVARPGVFNFHPLSEIVDRVAGRQGSGRMPGVVSQAPSAAGSTAKSASESSGL